MQNTQESSPIVVPTPVLSQVSIANPVISPLPPVHPSPTGKSRFKSAFGSNLSAKINEKFQQFKEKREIKKKIQLEKKQALAQEKLDADNELHVNTQSSSLNNSINNNNLLETSSRNVSFSNVDPNTNTTHENAVQSATVNVNAQSPGIQPKRSMSDPASMTNNSNHDESLVKKPIPQVLGHYSVRLLCAANLGKPKQRSHLVVYSESGEAFRSHFVAGTNPIYNQQEFEFVITDITHTIGIELIFQHTLKANTTVAQAVIPITNIINSTHRPNESTHPHYYFSGWIPFWPVLDDSVNPNGLFHHKLPFAEHGIPSTGMEKKKFKQFGAYLQLEIKLKLDFPLGYCYFHSTSLSALKKPAVPVTLFHKSVFKRNMKRLRRQIKQKPITVVYMEQLLDWKYPWAIEFLFIFFWFNLCFRVPIYAYPILFACITLLCGWLSYENNQIDSNPHSTKIINNTYQSTSTSSNINKQLTSNNGKHNQLSYSLYNNNLLAVIPLVNSSTHINTWQEDADPYEWRKEGVLHKMNRYKAMLSTVGYYSGLVATALEKISNALNFTDFNLSIYIYCCLFTGAFLLTVALYIIPLRLWIFSSVMIRMALGGYKFFKIWIATAPANIILPNTTPSEEIAHKSTQINTNHFAPIIVSNNSTRPAHQQSISSSSLDIHDSKLRQFINKWKSKIEKIIKFYLFNLMSHVPDEYEFAHRVISSRGIIYTENNTSRPRAVASVSPTVAPITTNNNTTVIIPPQLQNLSNTHATATVTEVSSPMASPTLSPSITSTTSSIYQHEMKHMELDDGNDSVGDSD